MFSLAEQGLLGAGLAVWLRTLVGRHEEGVPLRSASVSLLFFTLSAFALGWCWLAAPARSFELLRCPPLERQFVRFLIAGALGLVAMTLARGRLALSGLALGGIFSVLGALALRWLMILQAWRVMGRFSGVFFPPLVPLALGASLALGGYALLRLAGRGRAVALSSLIAVWGLPAALAHWRLVSVWGADLPTLAQELGLPEASAAPRSAVAWLYPSGGRDYGIEERKAVAAGVDISPDSLEKIERYLRRRDFRTVFLGQALSALRQGWLFWWEEDRAYDAAVLARPGLFAVDYKRALGLLRAGPVTEERYRKLKELAEIAAARKEGFEDVNTSQLIFEGFASAFARFGDEEPARRWLFRVDDLWPIYDKKIEVSPLETVHDGAIDGQVLVGGAAATALKVGLFFVGSSTSVTALTTFLSQSEFPDAQGRFRFDSLAPGTYLLALMGRPEQLRGRILNSPGLFDLTPEAPFVTLDPIRIEKPTVTFP